MSSADNIGAPVANPPENNEKRKDYISWEQYFMGIALLAAERSKDPNCIVGACIVGLDNRIVGIGYNGMSLGCDDDKMPWGKDKTNILNHKKLYVCHAELNALAFRSARNLLDYKMYVTRIPCNNCAQQIIQNGIKEVIYLNDHEGKSETASRIMFDRAKVKLRQYELTGRVIEIKV